MMQHGELNAPTKLLKQRLQIENYTAYSKIGILQHILHIFNIQHTAILEFI